MAHRMRCDPTICQAFRLDLLIPLCIFWFGHLARRTGFRVLSMLVPPPAREQWRELRLEARGQRRKVLETYLRWPHAHGSQDVVGQPTGVPEAHTPSSFLLRCTGDQHQLQRTTGDAQSDEPG